MVNFMCQLDCIKEYICSKELFLGVTFRGFLKETDVWFSRLSGEDLLSIWVAPCKQQEPRQNHNKGTLLFLPLKSGLGF